MAIVSASTQLSERLTCAICSVSLTLDSATAGLYDANNQQTLACVSHFSEPEKLIIGWADFINREQKIFAVRMQERGGLTYRQGGANAWPNP